MSEHEPTGWTPLPPPSATAPGTAGVRAVLHPVSRRGDSDEANAAKRMARSTEWDRRPDSGDGRRGRLLGDRRVLRLPAAGRARVHRLPDQPLQSDPVLAAR